jgi:hypothetical protein
VEEVWETRDYLTLNSSVRSSLINSAFFRAEAPTIPGPDGGDVGDQGLLNTEQFSEKFI